MRRMGKIQSLKNVTRLLAHAQPEHRIGDFLNVQNEKQAHKIDFNPKNIQKNVENFSDKINLLVSTIFDLYACFFKEYSL